VIGLKGIVRGCEEKGLAVFGGCHHEGLCGSRMRELSFAKSNVSGIVAVGLETLLRVPIRDLRLVVTGAEGLRDDVGWRGCPS